MAVTRTLYHVHKEEWKISFQRTFFQTILMGMLQGGRDRPLSMIREHPGVLKSIFEFAVPVPDEKGYYFKVSLEMCVGTVDVLVEALDGSTRGGTNAVSSLSSPNRFGAQYELLKPFLKQHAGARNQDGTYVNEGRLRILWKEFGGPRCSDPEGSCKMCCLALPGDTIYLRRSESGRWQSIKYEPASQEDIKERGWLQTGPGGFLFANAGIARTDPSQLELDSDLGESDYHIY